MASRWLSHTDWEGNGLLGDSLSQTGKTAAELELRSHTSETSLWAQKIKASSTHLEKACDCINYRQSYIELLICWTCCGVNAKAKHVSWNRWLLSDAAQTQTERGRGWFNTFSTHGKYKHVTCFRSWKWHKPLKRPDITATPKPGKDECEEHQQVSLLEQNAEEHLDVKPELLTRRWGSMRVRALYIDPLRDAGNNWCC